MVLGTGVAVTIPKGFMRQGLLMQCNGCAGAGIALVLVADELREVGDVVLDADGEVDEVHSWRTTSRHGRGEVAQLQVLGRHGARVVEVPTGWRVTCKKGHENRLSRRRAEQIWASEWVPNAPGVVLHAFTP